MTTNFINSGIRYSLITIPKGIEKGDPIILSDPTLVNPRMRRVIYGLAERHEPKGFVPPTKNNLKVHPK
jgi:hypothetical protein